MMELQHLPQDGTSSERGAKTKLFKLQQIDVKNTKNVQRCDSCAKPINLKGGKLGTCRLEGIKGSPVEPHEVD